MDRAKILLLLIGTITLVMFSIYLFYFEEQVNAYYACKDLQEFKEMTINCIVKEKYIDSNNHAFRTIDFNNCESMVIVNDTSSFYNFISENDVVIKSLNTDTIHVYRQDQVHSFKIYFRCEG